MSEDAHHALLPASALFYVLIHRNTSMFEAPTKTSALFSCGVLRVGLSNDYKLRRWSGVKAAPAQWVVNHVYAQMDRERCSDCIRQGKVTLCVRYLPS